MGRAFMLAIALALSGCAMLDGGGSWVEPVAAKDAARLAMAIDDLIQQRIPPARATLVLEPPQFGQADNAVTSLLTEALSRHGYALAEPSKAGADAHHVRYLITQRGDGVLLRATVDKAEAARAFARAKSGELDAATPFAIREAAR